MQTTSPAKHGQNSAVTTKKNVVGNGPRNAPSAVRKESATPGMSKTPVQDIYFPNNRGKSLVLPIPSRYFEAEPWRNSAREIELRDVDERLHGDGVPAVRFDDGGEEWWWHGRAHKDGDEPAIQISVSNTVSVDIGRSSNGGGKERLRLLENTVVWCCDGLIHRDEGAAIQNHGDEDSYRLEFWCRGRRHNSSGAAYINSEEKRWYYHGLLHREDGPAVQPMMTNNKFGDWFWYGHLLEFGYRLDKDFPFDEPPPEFFLSALADSWTGPNLEFAAVAHVIEMCCAAMPKLRILLEICNPQTDWERISQEIRDFLANSGKPCESVGEVYALPLNMDQDI